MPSSSSGNTPPSAGLRAEVNRLARLRHVQGALPPVLRGAPAAALAAGALAARLAGASRNAVEERLLGPAETIQLAPPPSPSKPRDDDDDDDNPPARPEARAAAPPGSEAAAAAAAEGGQRR